ncbi:MAG TPA: germination lipoprotein GerS-related protein [Clostridiaceae bacterium]
MKKLFIIILAVLLCSCGNKHIDPNEAIDSLKNLDSYQVDIKLQIFNSKEIIVHNLREYSIKDKGYRFDIDGLYNLVYANDKVTKKDIKTGRISNEDDDFENFYCYSSLQRYIQLLYTDENIKISTEKISNKDCQVIQLILPGQNRSVASAKLYIDKKNTIPLGISIFDDKGKERIKIEYSNFMPEADIKDKIMNIS